MIQENKMNFKLNEYFGVTMIIGKYNERRMVHKSWNKVIESDIELTANEAKDYCRKIQDDGTDCEVELVYNNLVWCASFGYSL